MSFSGSVLLPYLHPFYEPDDPPTALAFNPDLMDEEERAMFPEYRLSHHTYLGLRNLCLALWNLNPNVSLFESFSNVFIMMWFVKKKLGLS